MNDKKSSQDWMHDWQALQNQYWNAWSDATQKAVEPAAGAGIPWQQGIEQWQQMFANAGQQSEAAERVLGSAKSYVALMQSLLQAASGKGSDAAPVNAWIDAMRDGFNMPGADAMFRDNPLAGMLKAISGPGTMGLDQLNDTIAPMLDRARQEGMSWLHAPAFGFAREHQERYQRALVAFGDYQEALKQYNALILQSSKRSFEILESKLADRAESGRQIDSMRALYDLWVDAAEEAYAEIALSDEFSKVYGNLVNAQMRVRASLQAEAERVCAELNMPTRTEMESVHRRLHELNRLVRGRDDGDAGIDAELDDLRRQVDALRAQVAKAGSSARADTGGAKPKADPPSRRAPAKKPSTRQAKPSGKFDDAISSMRSKVGSKSTQRRSAGKRQSSGAARNAPARAPAKKTGKRGGGR